MGRMALPLSRWPGSHTNTLTHTSKDPNVGAKGPHLIHGGIRPSISTSSDIFFAACLRQAQRVFGERAKSRAGSSGLIGSHSPTSFHHSPNIHTVTTATEQSPAKQLPKPVDLKEIQDQELSKKDRLRGTAS